MSSPRRRRSDRLVLPVSYSNALSYGNNNNNNRIPTIRLIRQNRCVFIIIIIGGIHTRYVTCTKRLQLFVINAKQKFRRSREPVVSSSALLISTIISLSSLEQNPNPYNDVLLVVGTFYWLDYRSFRTAAITIQYNIIKCLWLLTISLCNVQSAS